MSEPNASERSESPSGPPSGGDEDWVEELAERYLDQLQAGERPDRNALLAAHPRIARLLERQLDLVECMHAAADTRAASLGATALLGAGLANPSPPQPQRVGRYLIQAVLGRGASGTVYRAFDPLLRREVALKVLRADGPVGPEFTERFEREARIAARLRHPHIVPLHETGEHEGRRYLDMELVRGETLEARLNRAPLTAREAAELVRKLAAALDYAHGLGIVHRDVKPGNVVIDERGEPQLTDFGLARHAGGEASLTEHGQIVGTPAYLSPEQAEGHARQVDRRSDVYSLGVILYRLLTGRMPFPAEGTLLTQLYQIVHAEPPPPRQLNPALPRDLETICLKALAKDPAERFASAADLAEELRRWYHDEPLHVRPPTLWERARRWGRRNRLAARVTATAAVLLVVVGGTLGALVWKAQVRESLEAEKGAQLKAWALLDQARLRLRQPTEGRREKTQSLLRALAEPRRLIAKGEERDRLDLEARSLYAASLGVPELRVEFEPMPADWFRVWRVALHPKGKVMAIGTEGRPVRWDRGQKLHLPGGLGPNSGRPRVAYSPDGKYLVFAPESGGLELWDGELTREVPGREWKPPQKNVVLAVGFAHQGQTLWACCDTGLVQSWSLPELRGGPSWQLAAQRGEITAAAFSADGTRLAVGDKNGRVVLRPSAGRWGKGDAGALDLATSRDGLAVETLAWSRDGDKLLAVGTRDGNVELRHASDGRSLHRFFVSGSGVNGIEFDPSGRWLLAGSRQGVTKVWDVKTYEQVLTGPLPPGGFSRDGSCFAAGGSLDVAFCDLLAPTALRPFTGHRASVERVAWCRDSKHLVSLDAAFEVYVWDVPGAKRIDSLRPRPGDFYALNAAVALSDDARFLAYTSGGNQAAYLLRDVKARQDLGGQRPLRGGFERMTYAGGKFRLVREEDVEEVETDRRGDKRVTHSVLYDWEVGQEPRRVGEIRAPGPRDRRRFLDGNLTPDARYFWWAGPREPKAEWRVEVYEVATHRLVFRKPWPGGGPAVEVFGAGLSPDGGYLWVRGQGKKRVGELVELASPESPKPSPDPILDLAPAHGRLALEIAPDESHRFWRFAVRRWGEQRSWLEFPVHAPDHPGVVSFSPDGRYLAWGDQSGTLTVADLPALEREVGEFERSTLPQ